MSKLRVIKLTDLEIGALGNIIVTARDSDMSVVEKGDLEVAFEREWPAVAADMATTWTAAGIICEKIGLKELRPTCDSLAAACTEIAQRTGEDGSEELKVHPKGISALQFRIDQFKKSLS